VVKRIDVSLVILLAVAAAVALIALVRDRSLPMAGLYASGRLLGSVWIELLLGFVIAGFLEVLISPAQLAAWVGAESSMRGILIGWGIGLMLPGGPYLLFPIAANLFRHGAAPGMLIALITAKTLVSPIRMLTYEAPLLGWTLTLARCAPALMVPPLMGLLGQWLFTFFTKK
jgi:uncharacterized membrane protein YraQ (UPF0718 family)